MNSDEETIVALATAAGIGAVAIVRMSGSRAVEIAGRIFRGKRMPAEVVEREVLFGEVRCSAGDPIDQVLMVVMRAPRSLTGEDVVEINTHGGLLVPRLVLRRAVEEGARPAEPGEFTKRAFLNGKIDLTQAEAVEEIVRASSEKALRTAVRQLRGGLSQEISKLEQSLLYWLASVEARIDFEEGDIEPLDRAGLAGALRAAEESIQTLLDSYDAGKYMRDGLDVVIVGKPNVGKSSLFNRLLGKDRVIVSEIAGTTRDVVDGLFGVDGLLIRVHDTAGLRDASDEIESEAVKRTRQAIAEADVALVVLDSTSEADAEDARILEEVSGLDAIVVANKADLVGRTETDCAGSAVAVAAQPVSAVKGWGIGALVEALRAIATERLGEAEYAVIVNERQAGNLREAMKAIQAAKRSLAEDLPLVLAASDLTHALNCLGEISGKKVASGVLDQIFSRFCVGK